MGVYQEATARQLDFGYEDTPPNHEVRPGAGERRLCEMCGRVEAHLTIPGAHGRQSAAVCLRCHYAVRQQRRMLRAALTPSVAPAPPRTDLIVQKEDASSPDRKYKELEHRRRRAQVAARKSLGE